MNHVMSIGCIYCSEQLTLFIPKDLHGHSIFNPLHSNRLIIHVAYSLQIGLLTHFCCRQGKGQDFHKCFKFPIVVFYYVVNTSTLPQTIFIFILIHIDESNLMLTTFSSVEVLIKNSAENVCELNHTVYVLFI